MTPLVSPLRIDRAIVALLVGCASLPAGGLHYMGSDGHVGRWLVAELENDAEICPLPWLATPRGIEGDLPPGLSFDPTDGSIEGTPLEAGRWTVRVTLDEVSCADRALGSVTVPVSFTIHNEVGDAGRAVEPPPGRVTLVSLSHQPLR